MIPEEAIEVYPGTFYYDSLYYKKLHKSSLPYAAGALERVQDLIGIPELVDVKSAYSPSHSLIVTKELPGYHIIPGSKIFDEGHYPYSNKEFDEFFDLSIRLKERRIYVEPNAMNVRYHEGNRFNLLDLEFNEYPKLLFNDFYRIFGAQDSFLMAESSRSSIPMKQHLPRLFEQMKNSLKRVSKKEYATTIKTVNVFQFF